jgi:hypothetical protein
MRRALLKILPLAVLPLLCGAADAPVPASLSPPETWLSRTTAEIQVLDKVNAQSATLTLKVGQVAENASLSIALRACDVRPTDLPQDATAYLDVADSRKGAPGFHGWIFANEPSLSMLEHPIYDLRLLGCH